MQVFLAQIETNLKQVRESGISEVTTGEWVLAAGVLLASILASIVVGRLVERLLRDYGPVSIRHLFGRLVSLLIVTLGFFYALSSVDVAVGPLLGGLGIIGIALAFALQDILANFAAGVMIQARRPIRIGDQIVTNEYEGQVEDVNFRVVRIRTFDGEEVYVPNSMVLQNPITNWTRTPTRRTSLVIGVAYDTDLALAQRRMVEALSGVDEIITDEHEVEALAFEFAESSINFEVRFWHGATIIEMWQARDAAAQALKRALDEAGITIPFPQRTLWFGPGNTDLMVQQRDSGPAGPQGRPDA